MTVVDASAIIDLLVPTDPVRHDAIAQSLPQPAAPWLAPDILPFEVFSVVRRHVQRGKLPEELANRALRRLADLPIELIPTRSLIRPAWAQISRYSASTALYATLALRAKEPLLTTDPQLADEAREAGVEVHLL
jgi:predicted nucleic acid-binding protein